MALRSKRGQLKGTIRHARHKGLQQIMILENRIKFKRPFQKIDITKQDWSTRK